MNVFDVLSYIGIMIIAGIVKKLWSSLDTYFDKKAENLATRQDVTEITLKTEQVQADFHKLLGKFDADLKFKYEFYEKKYRELYSSLFYIVCESESFRYIMKSLSEEQMLFSDYPIVEWEIDNNEGENQEIEKTICEKLLDLIKQEYVYASPSLIKLASALINIGEYQTNIDSEEQKRHLECQLKAEIVRMILKDYYWLRRKFLLQENEDESEMVESGEFIPTL